MGLKSKHYRTTFELLELVRLENNHWTARVATTTVRSVGWFRNKKEFTEVLDLFCSGTEPTFNTKWYHQLDGTEYDDGWTINQLTMRHLRLQAFHEAD